MSYSALFIVAGIIIYGILEYKHRETIHREIIGSLRDGKIPPARESPRPEAWKLFTTGGVGLILLAALAGLVMLGVNGHNYAKPYFYMATGVGLVFTLVAFMFIRDVRSYTSPRKE